MIQPSGLPAPPIRVLPPGDRPNDRIALPPGARLGELEIVRVLAAGGFGIVYVARDHSLDRDVAVKEFMPGQLAGRVGGHAVRVRSAEHADIYAAGLRSFIDEAKLLARFSHPAMVKVYRILEANGTAYMVMPYLRGPTLSDVRRAMSGPPTEAWLRRVVDPLLDALAMLHDAGFYHRDISPDNVLMTGDGAPVLLDFGAARRLIGDRTESLTAILKPRYAPIEQYAETKRLRQGPWTDLYALAAMLTYLLDGEPPPASTARAIHDERAPMAGRRIPDVSATLLSAIDWALAVRPLDRPQSVAEFRRALDGRPVAPAPNRTHLPRIAARAGEVSDDAPGRPFTATVRLERPAAPEGAARFPAWRRARFFVERPWRVAAGGVLVALAVAWPVARQLSARSVEAGGEPLAAVPAAMSAQEPKRSAPATTPGGGALPAPPVTTAALPMPANDAVMSASEASLPAGSGAPAPAAPAGLAAMPKATPAPAMRHVAGHAATPADRTRKTASGGPSARNVRTAALPRSPGPVEMCAGRNFFVRPYCVQRECDRPLFKNDAYCLQLRQVAQYRRDRLP